MQLPGKKEKGSHKEGAAWLTPSEIGKAGTTLYLRLEVTLGSSQEEPDRFPQISGQLRMQTQVGASQG